MESKKRFPFGLGLALLILILCLVGVVVVIDEYQKQTSGYYTDCIYTEPIGTTVGIPIIPITLIGGIVITLAVCFVNYKLNNKPEEAE